MHGTGGGAICTRPGTAGTNGATIKGTKGKFICCNRVCRRSGRQVVSLEVLTSVIAFLQSRDVITN